MCGRSFSCLGLCRCLTLLAGHVGLLDMCHSSGAYGWLLCCFLQLEACKGCLGCTGCMGRMGRMGVL